MNNGVGYGLLLMVVGMLTVFLILWLLILLGKGLIWFVNRYLPEESSDKPAIVSAKAYALPTDVSNEVLVAITSAVHIVSQGKGHVTSIHKKN